MHFEAYLSKKFDLYFIGGAPRSGTTALHALVCTSTAANGYVAECRYLTLFMQPFLSGLNLFESHTSAYFDTKDEFATYHSHLLQKVIGDAWAHLGSPKILALKDPDATKVFHYLVQLLPGSRYIVSARDPRDVVASRVTIHAKNGRDASDEDIALYCASYNESYQSVAYNKHIFGDKLLILQYEEFSRRIGLEKLEEFGVTDIDPAKMWKDAHTDLSRYKGGDFDTPLYGAPMDGSSIGRFRQVLSDAAIQRVLDECGPVAAAMGVNLS